MNGSFKYFSFISYSSRDAAWAERLVNALETYELPKSVREKNGSLPERLYPVCRDRDELAAGGKLSEAIQEKLRQSWSLVVICSPNSVKSKWVDHEIRYYKSLGYGQRIFPFILAGEPLSIGETSCMPQELLKGMSSHQLAVAPDVRIGKDDWKNALLKLIAGIVEINYDELRRRDLHRRERQAYLDSLSNASRLLQAGNYCEIKRILLAVANKEPDFDFRHWEWGNMLLNCSLDAYTYTGHSAAVTCVGFNPSLEQVAAGAKDGSLRVWEVATGNQILSVDAHSGKINDLVWDARFGGVLTAGADRSIKLWDVSTGEMKRKIDIPEYIYSPHVFSDFTEKNAVVAAVIADAKHNRVIAATGRSVTLFDMFSGEPALVLAGHDDIGEMGSMIEDSNWIFKSIAFIEASNQVAAISRKHAVFWDLLDGSKTGTFDAPDGQMLVGIIANSLIVSLDVSENSLHFWGLLDCNFEEGKVIHLSVKQSLDIQEISYAEGIQTLLTAGCREPAIWDIGTSSRYIHQPQLTLKGHEGTVLATAITHDGRYAVTGDTDCEVKLWSTLSCGAGQSVPIDIGCPNNATFSQNGKYLAISDHLGKMAVCRVEGSRFTRFFSTESSTLADSQIQFDPQGQYVAFIGDADPEIQVWSLENGSQVCRFYLENERILRLTTLNENMRHLMAQQGGRCSRLAFGSEGWVVAGSSMGMLSVFNLRGKERVHHIQAHDTEITGVVFSIRQPDCVYSIANNGQVRRWSVSSGGEIPPALNIEGAVTCTAILPHKDILVFGLTDGTLLTLNLENNSTNMIKAHNGTVSCLCVSTDGSRIVTGGVDGRVKLFFANMPIEIIDFKQSGSIRAVDISVNRKFLLTITIEDGLILWDSADLSIASEQDLETWRKQRLKTFIGSSH